tara:strand:- start:19192 stop:19446 length:255 start_codon:yes stop_codon:yes gene_type:complete
MTQQIVQALNAKYMASKLEAAANLQNYLTNPAGIGEHPDIVAECDKLLKQISDADGYLTTLQNMMQPATPATSEVEVPQPTPKK